MKVEWLIPESLPLTVFSMSKYQIPRRVKIDTEEKINSSEYYFIAYFVYILERPQYLSNSSCLKSMNFKIKFWKDK